MNSTIERSNQHTGCSGLPCQRTDEDLLSVYRERGDRRAFDELVHRYEQELFNYLRRYLGDEQMAEDTFQLTFLQVHLKCDQFETGRRVRPWLYAVATNQAIDVQRRNRRHRMVSLDRRAGGEEEDESALVDLLGGKESSPADQFASDQQNEEVRRCVDDLPDALRRVVILVYYQGLKYREAAEVLSIPVGTVKSRLHAAIGKLNESLTLANLPGND
jgi:RNA polymerase sigma-70 factor (ECF subfamily)